MDYIDLVLFHCPPDLDDNIIKTWKVLEDVKNNQVVGLENKVKHIGVSNYDIHHLEILIAESTIKPYANQIEISPFLTRVELVKYCNKNNIKIVAHSSLTKGKMFNDPKLIKLAQLWNCSVPILLLCWAISKNFVILPRTSKLEHLEENIKCLKQIINESVFNTMDSYNINFATHRKYLGIKVNKRELLELFNDHFNSFVYYTSTINARSFPREGQLEFDINQLTITNSIAKMRDLFEKFGIIIFRDYACEDKLVIGCGNYSLANCGGYPFSDDKEETRYHAEHHHSDCYTINPCPSYNPSAVGAFSIHMFKNIPDESFTHIDIEGTWINATDIFYSEMLRLLKNNGKISCNANNFMTKLNGKLEILEGMTLSDCVKI